MAFKMSGFSAFTKTTDPFGNRKKEKDPALNQDPGSGLNQQDEIYQEIVDNKNQIKEFEYKIKADPEKYKELADRGVNPIIKLNEAMNKNIKAWEGLTGKTFEFPE